jgi:hypothetical protein
MAWAPDEAFKRFKKAEARKSLWDSLYDEAYQYAMPNRNTIWDTNVPGEDKSDGTVVYDSTAIDGVVVGASNLQSSLVPPLQKWMSYGLSDLESSADMTPEVRKALDVACDRFFAALRASNFDTQAAQAFQDVFVGTGALLVDADPRGGIVCTSVPVSQLYPEEGPYGRIDTAFRKHKMPARIIERTWPDVELTRELREKLDGRPEEDVELLEVSYPDVVRVLDPATKKMITMNGYVYSVYTMGDKKEIVHREQRTSPWVIFRWSNLPGEVMGRGPVLSALPDIKTANKVVELVLKNASIAVTGMWQAEDDGVINLENIELTPGAIIAKAPGSQGLMPLQPGTDFNVSQIILQDLRKNINRMLYAQPIGEIDQPVKSATEIAYRAQSFAKLIGAAYGKLTYEFVEPFVRRVTALLEEQGVIEPILGQVFSGRRVIVKYESPLSRAADEEKITDITRYVQTLAATLGPQIALMLINPDVLAQKLAALMNVPSGVAISKEQAQAVREMLAQMMQQQGQQAAPQEAA